MKIFYFKITLSFFILFFFISHAKGQLIEGNSTTLRATSIDNNDILYFWHDGTQGIAGKTDATGSEIWTDTIIEGKPFINGIYTFENYSKYIFQSCSRNSGTNVGQFSILDSQGLTVQTFTDTIDGFTEIVKRNDTSFYKISFILNLSHGIAISAMTLNLDTIFHIPFDSIATYGRYPYVNVLPNGDLMLLFFVMNELRIVKVSFDGQIKWEKYYNLNFDYSSINYTTNIGYDILSVGNIGDYNTIDQYNLLLSIDSSGTAIKRENLLLKGVNQYINYSSIMSIYKDSVIYLFTESGAGYRLYTYDLNFQQLCEDSLIEFLPNRYLEMFGEAYQTKDKTINNIKYTEFLPIICTVSTSISENAQSEKEIIYPNPSDGIYNYEIQLTPEFQKENLKVDIIDINGKVVYSEELAYQNSISGQLNLKNLTDGFYIFSISNDISQKVIKRLIKISKRY